ncbi:DNA-binding transcriptional regulator [Caulobacter sp. S45]|uniref:helix-turn-helix domain-containing protein n=1 Tax=Caulobacter sp. S45 TaxID=1641861 RepID=UPI0020C65976|nr:helix-turn-helix domain-containing protein [Caulobacter sp. S45]
MAIVCYTHDPTNPETMSVEEWARLDAMTDEDITVAAESDPDNPPLTDEELLRMRAARLAKRVRAATGLTQTAFAERYHIDVTRLSDLEQGRVGSDTTLLAYLTVIGREREAVDRALTAA